MDAAGASGIVALIQGDSAPPAPWPSGLQQATLVSRTKHTCRRGAAQIGLAGVVHAIDCERGRGATPRIPSADRRTTDAEVLPPPAPV